MRTANRFNRSVAVVALALLAAATAAHADPLVVDSASGKAWHYGPGPVPVYYDLGNFATPYDWANYPAQVIFDNAAGAAVVKKGYRDWSSVPTTSLRAVVKGDFSLLGLPDINGSNAQLVIGAWNGGGVQVVFDDDGSIMENFFGVGPNILGISSPEFADEKTGYITESWTVLNGQAVAFDDAGVAAYQGVATHEFGHSLGLAHTQTNGAAYYYGPSLGESTGPQSCSALPYRTNVAAADVETMDPFADPTPITGTGEALANIHTTNARAAISDLYPGKGWPAAYGTITGTVYDVDGKTPLTGVNVIARNLDDPFTDANSTLTGAWTQGLFGPDGTYTLHGLKPGARYVVYVDAIIAGGYPTPPLWFLPGAERFYAGPRSPGAPFDPCAYQVISPRAGRLTQADIAFERVPGAPVLVTLGYGTGATSVTGDGAKVTGNYGRYGPPFQWTEKTGVVTFDVATTGDVTSISHNGKYIATTLLDADGNDAGAWRWDEKSGWLQVAPAGSCGSESNFAWGVADDGTVYGMSYVDCELYKTFRWSPRTGTKLLPSATKRSDGRPASGHLTRMSSDGSTLGGFEEDDQGNRFGVTWVDGKARLMTDAKGVPFAEVTMVSGDGNLVGGSTFTDQDPVGYGWRQRIGRPGTDYFAPLTADAAPLSPYATNRDGVVMAGLSGDPFWSMDPAPFLWTKELGAVDLDQFLQRQGTSMEQYGSLWAPMAFSDDGSVLVGWGFGVQGYTGWVLQMAKAFVCHLERGERGQGHTVSAGFPGEFDEHLRHGDTAGRCAAR